MDPECKHREYNGRNLVEFLQVRGYKIRLTGNIRMDSEELGAITREGVKIGYDLYRIYQQERATIFRKLLEENGIPYVAFTKNTELLN